MTPREVEALCNMIEKEMNQHNVGRIFILNLSPMQTRAEDRILEIGISADYKEPTRLMVLCCADELENMREWLATALHGIRTRNETHTHWRLKWDFAENAFFEVQGQVHAAPTTFPIWLTKRANVQTQTNRTRNVLADASADVTITGTFV